MRIFENCEVCCEKDLEKQLKGFNKFKGNFKSEGLKKETIDSLFLEQDTYYYFSGSG